MIICPPDWTAELGEDGCTLSPPEGRRCGEIRYRQRLQPLRRARAVAAELLQKEPQFSPAFLSDPELFITAEGEYAALLSAVGHSGGSAIAHSIGLVFADDSINVLHAVARQPEYFDPFAQMARYLIYYDKLALGIRQRRFLYTPPPQWQALPSGLLTHWYPLDFPRNSLTLAVHPATPRDGPPELVFEVLLQKYREKRFKLEEQNGPEPVTSEYGLHGQAWCIVGTFPGQERLLRDLLVMADTNYLYALVLESTPAVQRQQPQAILPAVARSVRPIPPANLSGAGHARKSFSHWAF